MRFAQAPSALKYSPAPGSKGILICGLRPIATKAYGLLNKMKTINTVKTEIEEILHKGVEERRISSDELENLERIAPGDWYRVPMFN